MKKIFSFPYLLILLLPSRGLAQNAFIKNIGSASAMFYEITIFKEENLFILQKNETIDFAVSPSGQLFECAYKNYPVLILFPSDSILYSLKGDIHTFKSNNELRNNDFQFINDITAKMGAISSSTAFEETLPNVDYNGAYNRRRLAFYKTNKILLPKAPENNAARDSMLYDMYSRRMDFLKNYKLPLSPQFVVFFEKYIYYKYLSSALSGVNKDTAISTLPKLLSRNLQHPELISDTFLNIASYRHFLSVYKTHLLLLNNKRNAPLLEELDVIDKNFNQKSKAFLLFSTIKNAAKANKINSLEAVSYHTKLLPEDFKTELESIFKNKTYNSEEANKTMLSDKSGNTFSLEELLKNNSDTFDFYILDFWATWCIPCLRDMKYYEENKKYYRENKIAYILINVDENHNTWANKPYAADKNFEKSYHLINGLKSNYAKKLKIKAIPRYLFYDAKFNIIDSDLIGPSSTQHKKTIEQHLKRNK